MNINKEVNDAVVALWDKYHSTITLQDFIYQVTTAIVSCHVEEAMREEYHRINKELGIGPKSMFRLTVKETTMPNIEEKFQSVVYSNQEGAQKELFDFMNALEEQYQKNNYDYNYNWKSYFCHYKNDFGEDIYEYNFDGDYYYIIGRYE